MPTPDAEKAEKEEILQLPSAREQRIRDALVSLCKRIATWEISVEDATSQLLAMIEDAEEFGRQDAMDFICRRI